MIDKEHNSIHLTDENGNRKEYQVVLTFETEENDNFYVVYTDGQIDEDGYQKTYAGIYDNSNGKEVLLPIQTEAEWMLIEKLLEKIDKENED